MRHAPLALSVLALAAAVTWSVRAETQLPSLVARYELRRPSAPVEHLELVRTHDRVAHRFVERDYRELWKRDARGELEHVRAYPAQGKSVHYTAGDLRTIHVWPSWDALAQLLADTELHSLKQAGQKKSFAKQDAALLTGTLRGKPAKIEWLPGYGLPAKLSFGEGKQQLVIELKQVEPCGDEKACGGGEPALRSIEFADLGDKEYDPFVRRFLASQDTHHAHALH